MRNFCWKCREVQCRTGSDLNVSIPFDLIDFSDNTFTAGYHKWTVTLNVCIISRPFVLSSDDSRYFLWWDFTILNNTGMKRPSVHSTVENRVIVFPISNERKRGTCCVRQWCQEFLRKILIGICFRITQLEWLSAFSIDRQTDTNERRTNTTGQQSDTIGSGTNMPMLVPISYERNFLFFFHSYAG